MDERLNALSHAVAARHTDETPEDTVARAEAFHKFLIGESEK